MFHVHMILGDVKSLTLVSDFFLFMFFSLIVFRFSFFMFVSFKHLNVQTLGASLSLMFSVWISDDWNYL